MERRTKCDEVVTDQGNMVNENSFWTLTGVLVKRVEVAVESTICSKKNEITNAFLPIPELTRQDAIDLCKKFGENVFIAGDLETKEAFEDFYDELFLNQKYIDQCGFYDNGRLKTWLPYHSTNGKLVHDLTGRPLLPNQEDKYFAIWYGGPTDDPTFCVLAYFGIVPKYKNIEEDGCQTKKCTACQLQNSYSKTSSVKLNGLCKYTFFDKDYEVQYDPLNIISYMGTEKSIITYDFVNKLWVMKDVTNPLGKDSKKLLR